MKPSTEQDYYERIVRTLVYIQRHLKRVYFGGADGSRIQLRVAE